MTIAMAAYTFTTFTMAIINMVKYRKYHSPILSAVEEISFASALVSMLSLETAMLAAFGDTTDSEFSRIMTASTGACVCSIILIMAICMIAQHKANKKHFQIDEAKILNVTVSSPSFRYRLCLYSLAFLQVKRYCLQAHQMSVPG